MPLLKLRLGYLTSTQASLVPCIGSQNDYTEHNSNGKSFTPGVLLVETVAAFEQ